MTAVNGPWRLLVLDPDAADPKWVLATVVEIADVQPAAIDSDGQVADWVDVVGWVAGRTGRPAVLTPMRRVQAWRVDEAP